MQERSTPTETAVRGVRLDDRAEAYRLDGAECAPGGAIDGAAVVISGALGPARVERVEIATGERELLLEREYGLRLKRVVGAVDDALIVIAWFGGPDESLLALDVGTAGQELWRNDEFPTTHRCVILDGGPDAAPGDARIGCDKSDGHGATIATAPAPGLRDSIAVMNGLVVVLHDEGGATIHRPAPPAECPGATR